MRYLYVVQKQKGVADAMSKAWFYIRTEKLLYRANCLLFSGLAELSIVNGRFLPAILVKEKTRIFCDSALLSQHPTFEFH